MRRHPLVLAGVIAATSVVASRVGYAQSPPPPPPPHPSTTAAEGAASDAPAATAPELEAGAAELGRRRLADLEKAPPPPTNVVYLQYGVAFTAELVSVAGPLCDNVAVPCIIGPGGGVAVRAGWRSTGALYIGGAYEFSKQDPNKLFRLAILQQARGETRYYFVSGRATEPYVSGGLGVAGYGNEWRVDTWGPAAFVGLGIETQITRQTVVGLALNYRGLYFGEFTDTTGAVRAAGITQLVGLDLVLEQRQPIFTEASDKRR